MIKSEMSKQAFRKDEIIASEAYLGEEGTLTLDLA